MKAIQAESVTTAAEIRSTEPDIQEGWASVLLPEVFELNPPKPPADALPANTPVTFVPMPAVDADAGAITRPETRPYSKVRNGFTSFREGDVIFAKITPCMENGKAAIARNLQNDIGFGSTEFHVLRSNGAVLPNFIYHFIRQESFRKAAEAEMTGSVGQKRVPADFMRQVELPIAPLKEQKRIVAKIEELLARVNAARARVAKVAQILKRFRQAVLAAACSGRLTGDWREQHPAIEPAADLLLRIKEARLKAAKANKDRAQVLTAFEAGISEPSDIDLRLTDIPDAWAACRVGAIGTVCNGSTPSRKHPGYWRGKIPWVSSGEVQNNVISETRERITQKGYQACSVRLLPRRTVLIAMIGEGKTRGRSAVLDIEATINQNIAAILLEHGLVVPKYLWYWFQLQYEATREEGSGTGPQALNCQRVRELPFILPPFDEQPEIVRRVEALFKLADTVEKRVEAATKRAEKLIQAILAKSFRGELVPTEAELARREGRDYESASALLARIRSERASARNARSPVRRSVRNKKSGTHE